MKAHEPAAGNSGNLINSAKKLFFLNSLFRCLFLLVLQYVKNAAAYSLEPRNGGGAAKTGAAAASRAEELGW